MASSLLNNSMSISVSDDDMEDPSNRIRARNRRKRKKSGPRSRPDFTRKFVMKLLNCWPALLLLAAFALLAYEYFKIGGSGGESHPPLVKKSENFDVQSAKPKPQGNLNRLDPITRVVRGVRQLCLKLVPPEELELLEIPNDVDSSSPIKELVYATENDRTTQDGNFNLSVYLNGTRFNAFTGNQTLEQREESFKVTERAEVHCGFYSESGGYRISAEDQTYMNTCQVVVSTCAFGGGDNLYQPIGMSKASSQKVCYVAFWDKITLSAQEAEGNKVDSNHFIGKWRIVVVRDLPFRDQRLNGKIPKMLSHRLFPNSRYSIWVDSKSQFRRDPLGALEALLWRTSDEIAISEHGARSSVYDEAKAVVKKNKATPEEVEVQMTRYIKDGLPKDTRFNGHKALAEASIIVRKHTPMANLFMCVWFNEVVRFTSRDQLSFPYVLWQLKEFKHINMFPVCTRKDLVNSMGHLRKAKPLTN